MTRSALTLKFSAITFNFVRLILLQTHVPKKNHPYLQLETNFHVEECKVGKACKTVCQAQKKDNQKKKADLIKNATQREETACLREKKVIKTNTIVTIVNKSDKAGWSRRRCWSRFLFSVPGTNASCAQPQQFMNTWFELVALKELPVTSCFSYPNCSSN